MNVVVVARDPSRRRTLIRKAEEAGWTVRADVPADSALSAEDLDGVAAVILDGKDLDGTHAAREDDLVEPLTSREREVLEQLAAGLSNRQIARALSISEHTVKFHVSAILGKLGVSSRAAAVRHGMCHGLVTL
ncbi:MAG TPA: LuxR C-terminal-related transcriptional regulator [Vicinamibacterales bacterium]|nr:LuxR C-terminal-related transcriptional regulator [Vicinamibacterales bacterium]